MIVSMSNTRKKPSIDTSIVLPDYEAIADDAIWGAVINEDDLWPVPTDIRKAHHLTIR